MLRFLTTGGGVALTNTVFAGALLKGSMMLTKADATAR